MTLEGPKSKRGLFGFAMAVAGDLNQDSYPGIFPLIVIVIVIVIVIIIIVIMVILL